MGCHDADPLRMDASHPALPWMGTRTMVVCLRLAPAGRAIRGRIDWSAAQRTLAQD